MNWVVRKGGGGGFKGGGGEGLNGGGVWEGLIV